MCRGTDWIKKHKIACLLIVVILYLFLRQSKNQPIPLFNTSSPSLGIGGMESLDLKSSSRTTSSLQYNEVPPVVTEDRLVVQESNLSLVVKSVREAVKRAVDYADSNGGYMVSSSLSQPEEAPYATLVLRVPSKSLNASLEHFRSLALKVSSENLYGHDVTDQYVDVQARLDTLAKTKSKFEEIMSQATQVQDILTVQREIINIQSQIDSLKGRQLYLEKTAELARITLHFSTDEFALPYAPTGTFRPEVIFKTAVRSLVGTFRAVARDLIWIGVYAVIWVPILLVVLFFRRRAKKK